MHISEMQSKIDKMCFLLKIKLLEIVVSEMCILRQEYLSSGVNVLTNSLKISDVIMADILQLNLSRIHGKIGK